MRVAVALLLTGMLFPLTCCKKDEMEDVQVPNLPELETNKEVLLNGLTNPEVINFFDYDFIEQANPNLTTLPGGLGGALPDEVEAVYLDFLIKNGKLDYVKDILPNVGYPLWRRAEAFETASENGNIVVIPFATLASENVHTIIVAIPNADDGFYAEAGVARIGYYYLTTTRAGMATLLDDLAAATDNTFATLFNFLYFDTKVFDFRNESWWQIWDDYDDPLVSDTVTDRSTCTITYTTCLPYAFQPDEVEDRNCNGLEIVHTYSWECPGGYSGNAGDIPGGWIPGGDIITSTGGTRPGGGTGTANQGNALLDRLIANCASLTSPDVVVSNPGNLNAADCSALLTAIEHIGYTSLSPDVWLYLFQNFPELLELAGEIAPNDRGLFQLYVASYLGGNTTLNFTAFATRMKAVNAVQDQLNLPSEVYVWLVNQAIGIDARHEKSVAEEVLAFLGEHEDDASAQQAASTYINYLIQFNLSDIENTQAELTAFFQLQNSLADINHLLSITPEQVAFFVEYSDFDTVGTTDGFFGDYSNYQQEIAPAVVIYIIKKAAQAGAGALADIAVQWAFEYFLGEHPDPWTAWQNLDINEWQVLGSAIESATTGKYAPIVSSFTAASTYLLSDPNPTLEGFFLNLSIGAIGGFVANNIADYVGKIRLAFTSYGFLVPYRGLENMGIRSALMQLSIARRALIDGIWEDLTLTTTKGFYFEEILSYSRYNSGHTWLNALGEQGQKIDFYKSATSTGVQLKSSAADFINNPSALTDFLRNGCNQLKTAIENGVPGIGAITNGQLDIMIPPYRSGDVERLQQIARTWLGNQSLYNGLNLTIHVGTFAN